MSLFKKQIVLLRAKTENVINARIIKKHKVDCSEVPTINGIIFMRNNGGKFKIGQGVKINSRGSANPIGGDTKTKIVISKNAKLTIGNNVGISNSSIICQVEISIGNNVLIGGSTKIWDTDFHPLDPIERLINPNVGFKRKKIIIGDNVFIGGFSIILKGITIGDNSVIGAGSVVTKSIPKNEIWAGNPAKFIRKI